MVAERHDGQLVAIQSKFFAQDRKIQQKDVASFLLRANDGVFSSGLFVSTAGGYTKQALQALNRNPHFPVLRVDYSDFNRAPIDWESYLKNKEKGREELSLLAKKEPRPHQQEAIIKTLEGFKQADRGKLIMACGTGKTFTALKLAERMADRAESSHAFLLFMVPSLALMSQSIAEFSEQSSLPLRIFAVCSDTKVGKRTTAQDTPPENVEDMKLPATTDPQELFKGWEASRIDEGLTVVFATYQSIEVIHEAQKVGLPDFDLIICDEAHRTTGAKVAEADDSSFIRVHDQDYIAASKRLYMTATPRVYSDSAKTSASEKEAVLISMDDPETFGDTFYRIGFGEAVEKGLLTDYKVLVFGVSEDQVSAGFQGVLADQNKELKVNDLAKLIGCWSSLAKRSSDLTSVDFGSDTAPMRRAVAFSRSIRDSKAVTQEFPQVADQLIDLTNEDPTDDLDIEIKHIDGSFGAIERNQLLDWLKEEKEEINPTCRILSNARCLTEGVDVPNLDAVIFLNPRNSMVDIIQAVGRVMRKAENKQYGYIILPIVVPAGATAESSLDDNESYQTIWRVVQALRAHDERLGNNLEISRLEGKLPEQIQIDFLNLPSSSSNQERNSIGAPGKEEAEGREKTAKYIDGVQAALTFPVDAWKEGLYTKVVEKCGDRFYWADWTKNIGQITHRTMSQILAMLDAADPKASLSQAFSKFLTELQATLNPQVDGEQAIELLAQHIVTRPVFEKLFSGSRFTLENPISQAMQSVVEVFQENPAFARELEDLQVVYDRVADKVSKVSTAAGKQNIIKEIYDNFFRAAFPKTADRLGIVFTPVEVVDYILRSADVALQRHFGKRLSDRGVSILEPFAGTGTFITRLLQLGLIRPEDLHYKFTREIFANELVMLSYYIAAINIETVFAEEAQKAGLGLNYVPFEGMVLADTFQLTESHSQLPDNSVFAQNSQRAQRELDTAIEVIVMNPPYSVGQKSANDNNQNLKYPLLDKSIATTYAKESSGTNLNSLYDSYIRAIRWATDRISGNGVIAFVSNGSFIDGNAADGVRKTLVKEFSDIYIFNLRGGIRGKSGDIAKREGQNIFNIMTGVSVCLLVKKSDFSGEVTLHYHDIGDYLSQIEKLSAIESFSSIEGTPWESITPNEAGDWINQRNEHYDSFQPLGDKATKGKGSTPAVFQVYSRGLATSRDTWCYNYSSSALEANMRGMINYYNSQLNQEEVDYDATKISWNRQLLKDRKREVQHSFNLRSIRTSLYRPFNKQRVYFSREMNDMIYQLPRLFPSPNHQNIIIQVPAGSSAHNFSPLVSDLFPALTPNGGNQIFALYYYEPIPEGELALTVGDDVVTDGYYRRDNITDSTLQTYRAFYEDSSISKEDIFYYIYALLHHPTYRETCRADLMKMLPRIPKVEDFTDYARIGRQLAELHLNYETVDPHPLAEIQTGFPPTSADEQYDYYRVQKLKFGPKKDKTTIVLNENVTLKDIPLKAYEYEINGKSALEWIIDRYQVKTDKKSLITNDPNDWCKEVGDPRYILDLIKRIVTVSLETKRLVASLPDFRVLE